MNLLYDTETSNLVPLDYLEGWDGVGGGREGKCVYLRLIHVDIRQKPTQSAAAATAKLLQLYPTLCDPTDSSPPGSPVPGILQARTLEWVAISFSNS